MKFNGQTMSVYGAFTEVEPQYELIEDITLTEDVATINREEAPDGRAYNFSAVRILLEAQPTTGASSTSQLIFALYGNNVSSSAIIYHQVNNGLNTSARATSFVARNDCGFIEFYSANSAAIDTADALKTKPYAVVKPWENVQRINLGRYPTSLVIPAGTRIQIYGIWGD